MLRRHGAGGRLRGWVEPTATAIELLGQLEHDPRIRAFYTPRVLEAITRLWQERHARYALLDRLPQTFCHLDVFPRNVFIRQSPNSSGDTILIDWSFSGIAAIGEELVALVGASVAFMEAPVTDVMEIQETALDGYIAGLRDVGWRGNPGLVRSGYAAAAGLRYLVRPLEFFLAEVLSESPESRIEQLIGHPMDQILTNMAAVNSWLADLSSPV